MDYGTPITHGKAPLHLLADRNLQPPSSDQPPPTNSAKFNTRPAESQIQRLSKRKTGEFLGAPRGTAAGDAGQGARADARLSQRGHPGLGGNRVQPPGAPRDRLCAGGAAGHGAGRAAPQPFVRRVARRVSPGSETASASKRRHDFSGRRTAGDPEPLSSLSRRGSALSALGPQPGGSGGPAAGTILARLFPLDRAANADGRRAAVQSRPEETASAAAESSDELPPLLRQILAEYSATGLPPAYLPKNENSRPPQAEQGGAA